MAPSISAVGGKTDVRGVSSAEFQTEALPEILLALGAALSCGSRDGAGDIMPKKLTDTLFKDDEGAYDKILACLTGECGPLKIIAVMT